MYDAFKGLVVHNPSLELLPGLFANAAEPTEPLVHFYLEYCKYENWKLILTGVTQQGITLALEVVGYEPYVYVRQSEFPTLESIELLFADAPRNAPNKITLEKHWVAPPAPVNGKTPCWKLTFSNWQHLQRGVKTANSKEDAKKRCNFLQYEQLKYELVYLFERKLQLHGWNTLKLDSSQVLLMDIGNRVTTCALEYQVPWDSLSPNTSICEIPRQLIVTCDIETIAHKGVLQGKNDAQTRTWIHNQVARLMLRGFIGQLDAVDEIRKSCSGLGDEAIERVFKMYIGPIQSIEDLIVEYVTNDTHPDKPSLFLAPKAVKPHDYCTNIATHFFYLQQKEPLLCIRHVLGTVARLPHQNKTQDLTLTFDSERDMIMHWVHTVRHTFDAELLSGHNFILYDLPYLFDRAQVLDMSAQFDRLSRFTDPAVVLKENVMKINTKGRGVRDQRRICTPGLRQFDTLQTALQMHPTLENHKLTTVVEKLLGKGSPLLKKKDLAYEALAPYWSLCPETRWEIADYNGQDVYLVDELIRKCGLLDFAMETSADTSTGLTDVVIRGQSIRCWNQEAGEMFEQVLLDHNMRRRLIRVARSNMTYEQREMFYDADFIPDNGEDDPVPYEQRYVPPKTFKKKQKDQGATRSYRGARLVELKRGFYKELVLTYDFEGLYPSIAITFKLCFTRYMPHMDLYSHDALNGGSGGGGGGGGAAGAFFKAPIASAKHIQKQYAFDQSKIHFPTLPSNAKYYCWFWNDLDIGRIRFKIDPQSKEFDDDTYIILVVGCGKERTCFVYAWPRSMKETPKPIVCGSCEAAMKRRGITKKLMKQAEEAGNKLMYAKYNAQQLCFKCRANSIYGFHGARDGICEFVFISQCICLLGRILNEFTEKTLLHKYNRKCVYGDTDSVMPLLTGVTLEQAYKEAVDSCEYITSCLPGCLTLAFENIKCPSIFYTPKGYAYFKVWEGKTKLTTGKLVIQGLANKRRNYSKWFQNTCDLVLQGLLLPKHAANRKKFVLDSVSKAISDLENGRVSIKELARSCQIQEHYKASQKLAQKILAERMRKRGQEVPGGSRISFVYVAGSQPLNERAEIPEFVTNRGLQLDKAYYKKQLLDNVLKLLEFHPDIVLAFNQRIVNQTNPINRYFGTAK